MTWLDELPVWQQNDGADIFRAMDMAGKTVIDFGCGKGRYTLAAAQIAKTVYAADIDEHRLIEIESHGYKNIKTIKSDGTCKLDFAADNSIDMVLIYDLIHQLGPGRKTFLAETKRVLKNNGILSVLPFHIQGKEIDALFEEIKSYGFEPGDTYEDEGLHFEMHEFSHGNSGHIKDIPTGNICNFVKAQA